MNSLITFGVNDKENEKQKPVGLKPIPTVYGGLDKNVSRGEENYVYVNPAYCGSANDFNRRQNATAEVTPDRVYREQYCVCSKWPAGQRLLAIASGVLLGTVLGLVIAFALTNRNPADVIGGIFRTQSVSQA